eukprot:226864_1
MELSHSKQLKPVLKHKGKILNGIMQIEITNLDNIDNDMSYDIEFIIYYKLKLSNANQTAWDSKIFNIACIDEYNVFYLKVPLFLLSYTIQYKLSINKFNKKNNKILLNSSTYTRQIPSILINPTLEKHEYVIYADNNNIHSGVILGFEENDMIKIQTLTDLSLSNVGDIFCAHCSKVSRHPVDIRFIIDITNKMNAVTDLILRTKDTYKISIYSQITFSVKLFYDIIMNTEDIQDIECMAYFVSTYIYKCLYLDEYKYQIECVLGKSYLIDISPWDDAIICIYNDIQNGEKNVMNPQDFWGRAKYSCDICRIEMSWYFYVFLCECEYKSVFDDAHAFCIACIHSIMMQYDEFKPFISELLNNWLDDTSIEEIVTFCVGKVIKYGNKNKIIIPLIDNTKPIGTKRSMKGNDGPTRKNMKLQ